MPGPWGVAVLRLRQAKNWTREYVAKKTKMTPTTYGRIERGFPTTTTKLQDIADFFGVPIEHVLMIPSADREQAHIDAILALRRMKQPTLVEPPVPQVDQRRAERPWSGEMSPEIVEMMMRVAIKMAEETHARKKAAAKRRPAPTRRKKHKSVGTK